MTEEFLCCLRLLFPSEKLKPMKAKRILTILSLALTCFVAAPGTVNAQEKKPNIENSRVHPLDLPAVSVMQCISKWGGGSDKLVAAYDAASSHATSLAKQTNQQQITNENERTQGV